MKKNLFTLILGLTTCFVQSQNSTLTVQNGFGGGTYALNDTVYALANPTPTNFVFAKWQHTNGAIADTFAVPTLLRKSNAAQTLTPQYTASAAWTERYEVINGSNVYFYFPRASTQLRGVISFHHGATGNAAGWVQKLENRTFLNYAVSQGYGVFATESRDRLTDPNAAKQWSNNTTLATNEDARNIQSLLDTFRVRGYIMATTRKFGVGFSQGSGFTSLVSALLGFNANCLGAIPGINAAIAQTQSPTFFMSSRLDTLEDNQRLQKCITNYNTLVSRGIPTKIMIHEPFPITPNRFWRIEGLDSLKSVDIYNRLKNNGFLTTKNFLNFNPRAASSWKSVMMPTYNAYLNDIDDQLYVCFTEHKFHSDHQYYVIEFFNRFASPSVSVKEQLSSLAALRLFPNPNDGLLQFACTEGFKKINIFDVNGRLVQTQSFTNAVKSSAIEISQLSVGIYIVQITLENGERVSEKLVKK